MDDCSEDIYHILNYVKPSEKIKIYRVKKDYGFNSHGCRNLIMKEAENEFVILLDSDRKIINPESAFNIIRKRKLKHNVLYRFTAHTVKYGRSKHVSVNDFLISKTFFFSAGGYDEEWMGYRNGDRQYFSQLEHFGSEEVISEIDLLLTRKSSISLKNEQIISKNDKKISKKEKDIVKQRMIVPEPNKKILTFDWERIIE